MTARTWTAADVLALGVRTDVATAGSILGLSRTQSYEALRRGDFPLNTIKVGRRIVVPTAPLRELLGLASAPEQGASVTRMPPASGQPRSLRPAGSGDGA